MNIEMCFTKANFNANTLFSKTERTHTLLIRVTENIFAIIICLDGAQRHQGININNLNLLKANLDYIH